MDATARKPEHQRAAKQMADQRWRLNNLYWVTDEDGNEAPFIQNEPQQWYYTNRWYLDIIAKARQLGFCLSPETRILTADLEWVKLDSVTVGTEIMAVDEHAPRVRGSARKLRRAVVEKVWSIQEEAVEITLADGRVLVATPQHRFLVKYEGDVQPRWQEVDGLRLGDSFRSVTWPWADTDPSAEDGWFAGLMDGEGSFRVKSKGGMELSVSQVDGPVLMRAREYLMEHAYSFREDVDRRGRGSSSKLGTKTVHKLCLHRSAEIMRLLGKLRPTRFPRDWWPGQKLPGDGSSWVKIVGLRRLPKQRMIDLQTSEKTFIAEGVVSHNSTEIAIEMLDTCLFHKNTAAGIIDFTLGDATKKLEKVKFAYHRMPEAVRNKVWLTKENEEEVHFSNGSRIEVGTTHRGGTLQFLHVSEYGMIAAEKPDVAMAIKTGAFRAVHAGNRIVIESTAHGTAGLFKEQVTGAQQREATGVPLSKLDWRLHFFPWWRHKGYRLPSNLVVVDIQMREYFAKLRQQGIKLDAMQEAWYTHQFRDLGPDKCREEYPSTVEELFFASVEGAYFKREMSAARATGRVGKEVPHDPTRGVYTSLDIGVDGGMFLIFWQTDGVRHRCIDCLEDEDHTGSIQLYASWLDQKRVERGFRYTKHYTPHDMAARDFSSNGKARLEIARELLPVGSQIEVVAQVPAKADSIETARRFLANCWFDEVHAKRVVECLDNYQKKWNKATQQWSSEPLKNGYDHGADAFQNAAGGWSPDPETRAPRSGRVRSRPPGASSWSS